MARFMRKYDMEESLSDTGFGELYALERSIDRRLTIFLVVFGLIVVGALGSGSAPLSAVGFSIGGVICWLIAVSLILTTRKTGAVARALKKESESSYSRIEGRLYSKFIRWILGYIIPIFCAFVLTFGSVASSAGWLDSIWFYRFKVESKIDQIAKSLPEITIGTKKDSANRYGNNFEPIDSVISVPIKKDVPVTSGNQVSENSGKNFKPISVVEENSTPRRPQVEVHLKEVPSNKHFKSLDTSANKTEKPKQVEESPQKRDPHFKPLK